MGEATAHGAVNAEIASANDGRAKFRVWWIPQIPMKAFNYDVADYATGLMLNDVLGRYDLFQFENKVKPDYANMGGVQWQHPVVTTGEWWDLDEDEAEYFGWAVSDLTSKNCGGGSEANAEPPQTTVQP